MDVISSIHVAFVFRSISAKPFVFKLILLPLWPLAFMAMLIMWLRSKTFLVTFYNLRGRLHQTWAVPRYGFQVKTSAFIIMYFNKFLIMIFTIHQSQLQYFLPFARDGINDQIELAILRADKMGVKVLSLAALNKVL